eukprot:CAMPEP_0182430940 /NCGR_PEP_ID=MMETSP1167-20130531/45070_1 /TAXON_ID=2988 /ORGANISM="Mallomonas Sp, Strain CCMP3275" /LENGTH=263 /DNA_ID=CAMNT_0024616679 /DNA_START=71 /DNA_END=862 /DNA_ORIENTATION=+
MGFEYFGKPFTPARIRQWRTASERSLICMKSVEPDAVPYSLSFAVTGVIEEERKKLTDDLLKVVSTKLNGTTVNVSSGSKMGSNTEQMREGEKLPKKMKLVSRVTAMSSSASLNARSVIKDKDKSDANSVEKPISIKGAQKKTTKAKKSSKETTVIVSSTTKSAKKSTKKTSKASKTGKDKSANSSTKIKKTKRASAKKILTDTDTDTDPDKDIEIAMMTKNEEENGERKEKKSSSKKAPKKKTVAKKAKKSPAKKKLKSTDE